MRRQRSTFECRSCGTTFERRPSEVKRGRTGYCSTRCWYQCCNRTKHPLYAIWSGIRHRCRTPEGRDYHMYGGRGIYVCPEWDHSFEQFVSDMGPRPSNIHTLHRIDNDGPYSRENCAWALPLEQAQNRRTSRLLTFEGRTQTVAEWAHERDINVRTLRGRLSTGWTAEEALSRPASSTRTPRTIQLLTFNGETLPVTEWARRSGINSQTLRSRLNSGWNPKDAFERSPDRGTSRRFRDSQRAS